MSQNKLKSNSGEHRLSFTELCKLHLRKNRLFCTVIQPPWCIVNASTPEASSKWLPVSGLIGIIKIIAQVVLWQQLFAYFWICMVVCSDPLKYMLNILTADCWRHSVQMLGLETELHTLTIMNFCMCCTVSIQELDLINPFKPYSALSIVSYCILCRKDSLCALTHRFCVSRKLMVWWGGGWGHPQGAVHIAATRLGCKRTMVGNG